MNKLKLIPFSFVAIVCMFTLNSCNEDDILRYEENNSLAYFKTNIQEYSFVDNPDLEYADVEIPIIVIGPVSSRDRSFKVEIVPELTTATEQQYQIVEQVVKADKTSGYLKIRVKNDVEAFAKGDINVGLQLVESPDFSINFDPNSGLNNVEKVNMQMVLRWTNSIKMPDYMLVGNFLRFVTSTPIYAENGKVYGENNAEKTRTLLSSNYRSFGLYSRNLAKILKNIWPEKVNVNGYLGTDAETLEKYPYVNVNLGGMAAVLMRRLEQYVYDYNQAHPDAPLRHSDDAACYKPDGSVATVKKNGVTYRLEFEDTPLINVNPYKI